MDESTHSHHRRRPAVAFVRDSIRELCSRLTETTAHDGMAGTAGDSSSSSNSSSSSSDSNIITRLSIDDDDSTGGGDDNSAENNLLPRTRAESQMLIKALSQNTTLQRIRIRGRIGRRNSSSGGGGHHHQQQQQRQEEEDHQADGEDDTEEAQEQQQEAMAASEMFLELFIRRILPNHESLECVDFSSNRLSNDNIKGIGLALLAQQTNSNNRGIRALALADNDLGPDEIRSLLLLSSEESESESNSNNNNNKGSITTTTKLETLHLDRNPRLSDLGACRQIANSIIVSCGGNNNNKAAMIAPLLSSLKVLTMGMCGIDDAGGIVLAEAIGTNPSLTSLYLSYNQLGNATLHAFAIALRHNNTLTNLCISHNQFFVDTPTAATTTTTTSEANNAEECSVGPIARSAGSTAVSSVSAVSAVSTSSSSPLQVLKETLRYMNFTLEACTLSGSLFPSSSSRPQLFDLSTATNTTTPDAIVHYLLNSAKQEGCIIRDLCTSNRKLKQIFYQKLQPPQQQQRQQQLQQQQVAELRDDEEEDQGARTFFYPLGCYPRALEVVNNKPDMLYDVFKSTPSLFFAY